MDMINDTSCAEPDDDVQLLRNVIPLWHAEMAWAKELLRRAFGLNDAFEIMRAAPHAIEQKIPGTSWYFKTHGIGVDVYRTHDVGGIDFDFDKVDPDAWRLRIFVEKQINDGSLSFETYRHLIDDTERLKAALSALFRTR